MNRTSLAARRAWLAGFFLLTAVSVAAPPRTALPFRPVKSVADLRRELDSALAAKRPVMIWVRADWAASGRDMETRTFTDPAVTTATRDLVLLQADVTHFDSDDKSLIAHLGLRGAPAVLFYGANGTERRNFRVFAFMEAMPFAAMIREAVAPTANRIP